MAVAPTYPGVYIEEIPSGVRTIAGVATSIAAFVGWAPRGATDRATLILSWGDYEREFGGLSLDSYLSYAVYHFFQNGGRQAYVVRLIARRSPDANEAESPEPAVRATASLFAPVAENATPRKVASLAASNEGAWGNSYGVTITDHPQERTRFGLSVMSVDADGKATIVETFENLSMDLADSRFVESVVNGNSRILTATIESGATIRPARGGSNTEGSTPYTPLAGGADGGVLSPDEDTFETTLLEAIDQLDRIDLFNLLCVPGETNEVTLQALQTFCRERRAFLIADAPNQSFTDMMSGPDTQLTGTDAINAAYYFPWVRSPDPLQENRPRAFPPSGFVAGLYAKTDASRNVSKAPAGTDATVIGAVGLEYNLTDAENGILNVQAVNCLRTFPVYGTVVWGARTLRGNDAIGSEWKYVPVRRLALFLEESLYRGTQWIVFEPNGNGLWAQIRLNIGSFLQDLFRQGLFQGTSPREAYFVKCDAETTTQSDIDRGIVNIVVGFAPLKPAEFVIIKFQQMAGQTIS